MKLKVGHEVDIQEELETGMVGRYGHNILYTCIKLSISKHLKVPKLSKKEKYGCVNHLRDFLFVIL